MGFWADGDASIGLKLPADGLTSRDTLDSIADEPPKPNPQSKAALRPFDAGVRGGVYRFAAAVADAGVCARAWAAVKNRNRVCPMKSIGFDAVETSDARVLILGTLPGAKSLEQGEYYAHPQNSFWWIMGNLVGASPDLPYADRLDRLRKSGIALWDVCRTAERAGSSDVKILMETVETNDFRSFFARHTHVEHICFNGQLAEKLFQRKVMPFLEYLRPISHRVLDSTSPLHTIRRELKLLRWRDGLFASDGTWKLTGVSK
jgi:hypoxanthine-DNA glycosylase